MKKLIIALLFASAANSASALTIDFQDLASYDQNYYPSYTSNGYSFTSSVVDLGAFYSWGTLAYEYVGSTALSGYLPKQNITLKNDNSQLFNLVSIDLAGFFTDEKPFSVTFNGLLADNSIVNQTFDLNNTSVLSTFTFTNFNNLVSVTWSSGNYYDKTQFDNVVVNLSSSAAAVPEPETYAMFMAGLGLMGFAARRRKSA